MDIRNYNGKGTKGHGNGYSCTGLILVCRKCQKALLRFQKKKLLTLQPPVTTTGTCS